MASQNQIDANRANAQKSTGPKSLTGKATSRRNALRDGLTGQITTLSDEDRPIFEKLKAEMHADFNPQSAIERSLADAIAWDTWRLNHLRAIETNVYTLGQEEQAEEQADEEGGFSDFDTALADARTFRAESPRFDLMSLYEQRMTRNLHRNLAALRDLQAERKRNYERDKAEEVKLARMNEINRVPIHASTWPSKNGFIFSNEEIAAAAVRQRHLETVDLRFKNVNDWVLYGELLTGGPDSFLMTREEAKAKREQERPHDKIHGVSPESIAIRRLSHPEEFGIWPENRQ
jgi:hypothetical protein